MADKFNPLSICYVDEEYITSSSSSPSPTPVEIPSSYPPPSSFPSSSSLLSSKPFSLTPSSLSLSPTSLSSSSSSSFGYSQKHSTEIKNSLFRQNGTTEQKLIEMNDLEANQKEFNEHLNNGKCLNYTADTSRIENKNKINKDYDNKKKNKNKINRNYYNKKKNKSIIAKNETNGSNEFLNNENDYEDLDKSKDVFVTYQNLSYNKTNDKNINYKNNNNDANNVNKNMNNKEDIKNNKNISNLETSTNASNENTILNKQEVLTRIPKNIKNIIEKYEYLKSNKNKRFSDDLDSYYNNINAAKIKNNSELSNDKKNSDDTTEFYQEIIYNEKKAPENNDEKNPFFHSGSESTVVEINSDTSQEWDTYQGAIYTTISDDADEARIDPGNLVNDWEEEDEEEDYECDDYGCYDVTIKYEDYGGYVEGEYDDDWGENNKNNNNNLYDNKCNNKGENRNIDNDAIGMNGDAAHHFGGKIHGYDYVYDYNDDTYTHGDEDEEEDNEGHAKSSYDNDNQSSLQNTIILNFQPINKNNGCENDDKKYINNTGKEYEKYRYQVQYNDKDDGGCCNYNEEDEGNDDEDKDEGDDDDSFNKDEDDDVYRTDTMCCYSENDDYDDNDGEDNNDDDGDVEFSGSSIDWKEKKYHKKKKKKKERKITYDFDEQESLDSDEEEIESFIWESQCQLSIIRKTLTRFNIYLCNNNNSFKNGNNNINFNNKNFIKIKDDNIKNGNINYNKCIINQLNNDNDQLSTYEDNTIFYNTGENYDTANNFNKDNSYIDNYKYNGGYYEMEESIETYFKPPSDECLSSFSTNNDGGDVEDSRDDVATIKNDYRDSKETCETNITCIKSLLKALKKNYQCYNGNTSGDNVKKGVISNNDINEGRLRDGSGNGGCYTNWGNGKCGNSGNRGVGVGCGGDLMGRNGRFNRSFDKNGYRDENDFEDYNDDDDNFRDYCNDDDFEDHDVDEDRDLDKVDNMNNKNLNNKFFVQKKSLEALKNLLNKWLLVQDELDLFGEEMRKRVMGKIKKLMEIEEKKAGIVENYEGLENESENVDEDSKLVTNYEEFMKTDDRPYEINKLLNDNYVKSNSNDDGDDDDYFENEEDRLDRFDEDESNEGIITESISDRDVVNIESRKDNENINNNNNNNNNDDDDDDDDDEDQDDEDERDRKTENIEKFELNNVSNELNKKDNNNFLIINKDIGNDVKDDIVDNENNESLLSNIKNYNIINRSNNDGDNILNDEKSADVLNDVGKKNAAIEDNHGEDEDVDDDDDDDDGNDDEEDEEENNGSDNDDFLDGGENENDDIVNDNASIDYVVNDNADEEVGFYYEASVWNNNVEQVTYATAIKTELKEKTKTKISNNNIEIIYENNNEKMANKNNYNVGNDHNKKMNNAYVNPLGCYKDAPDRDLGDRYPYFTLDECFEYCQRKNFTYMAQQAGRTCFCGNEYGKYGKVDDAECSFHCKHNSFQTCGGKYRNSVFELNPIKQAYFGCYRAPDTLIYSKASEHASVKDCIEECITSIKYFAYLKNGKECFCFNKVPILHTSLNDCDVSCADDNPCGSEAYLSIYQTGISKKLELMYLGCFKPTNYSTHFDFYDDPLACLEKCRSQNHHYAILSNKCYCSYIYGSNGLGGLCREKCDKKNCKPFSEVKVFDGCYKYDGDLTTCRVSLWHCRDDHLPNISNLCVDCALGWMGPYCNMRDCNTNNGDCGPNKCETIKRGKLKITECVCRPGYAKKFYYDECTDLNECEAFNRVCNGARCFNTEGSYQCVCKAGQVSDNTCVDFDECSSNENNCDPFSTTCLNVDGSFECICKKFFKCNHDTCMKNDSSCEIGANCHEIDGKLVCDCLEGFSWFNHTCKDEDECLAETSKCDTRVSQCVNTENGFNCICLDGFECIAENCSTNGSLSCKATGNCQNFSVSYLPPYICECHEGLYFDDGECREIDFCLEGLNACDPKTSSCILYNGSYLCLCDVGYYLVNGTCVDVDECDFHTDICDPDISKCFNLIGAYRCKCSSKYLNIDNYTCGEKILGMMFLEEGPRSKYLYLLSIPCFFLCCCLFLSVGHAINRWSSVRASRKLSTVKSKKIKLSNVLDKPIVVKKIVGKISRENINIYSTKSFNNEINKGTTLKNRRKHSLHRFKPILSNVENDVYLKRNFDGVFDYLNPTRGIKFGADKDAIINKFNDDNIGKMVNKNKKKVFSKKANKKKKAMNEAIKDLLIGKKLNDADFKGFITKRDDKSTKNFAANSMNRPRRK